MHFRHLPPPPPSRGSNLATPPLPPPSHPIPIPSPRPPPYTHTQDPFTAALRAIRGRETSYSRRMQRIRAVNFGMQFCITPIVSFVTFAVYR